MANYDGDLDSALDYEIMACSKDNVVQLPYNLHNSSRKFISGICEELSIEDNDGIKYVPKDKIPEYLVKVLIEFNTLCDTKYAFVCHAEMKAILNCGTADLKNTRVYVTLFPCQECTKAIIQKGIKEVIYDSDKYHDTEGAQAARRMLDAAGVKYRQYKNSNKTIDIEL